MKLNKQDLSLYLVTDRHWTKDQSLVEQVEAGLKGGVTMVQLREKNLSDEEFLLKALELKELTTTYKVPFMINDNVWVAIQSDADGIHIGQDDLPADEVRKLVGEEKILGVSVQTVEQAQIAKRQGADYLGVGTVFSTDTKKDAKHVPLQVLKEICEAVNLPVVAIGGIDEDNVDELTGSGICGVAVVSAILASDDIMQAAKNLKRDWVL